MPVVAGGSEHRERMATSVGMLSCDELTEGMVLARPVVSPQGQLLAPAKTELSGRHLRLFKMWGVSHADIEGREAEASPLNNALSETERSEIEQSINQRFEGTLDHPVMKEIARIAVRLAFERGGNADV
jgi:hypothetical protein